jgi:hypothetical protein
VTASSPMVAATAQRRSAVGRTRSTPGGGAASAAPALGVCRPVGVGRPVGVARITTGVGRIGRSATASRGGEAAFGGGTTFDTSAFNVDAAWGAGVARAAATAGGRGGVAGRAAAAACRRAPKSASAPARDTSRDLIPAERPRFSSPTGARYPSAATVC